MDIEIIDPYEGTDKTIEYITLSFFPEFNLSVSSQCFFNFPQFEKDFEVLWQNKIITAEEKKFKWNYSLSSLAQYFHGLDKQWDEYFWGMVELEFNIRRHTLKHLASRNGREEGFYREKSIDYEDLIALLKQHREKILYQKNNADKIFCEDRYNEIREFISKKKIPENMAELESFSSELIQKAKRLTALF